jgi:hypothetical protein
MLSSLRLLRSKPRLYARWSHSAAAAITKASTPPTQLAKRHEAYSPYLNLGKNISLQKKKTLLRSIRISLFPS